MKKYHKTLLSTTLFHGIDENDLEGMLACLNVMVRHYRKNDIILMAGSKATSVGVMVEGTAQITREDAEGNRAILSELVKGDIFAEAYAAAARDDIPITVIATSDCSIVWVPFSKVVVQCSFSCQFHQQLIQNMMKIIAEKSIAMNEKMRILSCKTTKEKLLTYLHDYSEKMGKTKFKIPFSRNELADFLSVDRSAMSRELGKLRDEGYLNFNRNEFELL
ncbi:MAG: Crp/Fnr family transcriptional regulator [Anaerovoracaceae bacterium]